MPKKYHANHVDGRDYSDLFDTSALTTAARGAGTTTDQIRRMTKGVFLVHSWPMKSLAETIIAREHGPNSGIRVWIISDEYSLYRLRGLSRDLEVVADHELVRRSPPEILEVIEHATGGGRLDRHGRVRNE